MFLLKNKSLCFFKLWKIKKKTRISILANLKELQKQRCCFLQKDMIQILSFPELLFLSISILQSPNQKTELDEMFIFWWWFFDFSKLWPINSAELQNPGSIQNLNSVACSEIPYLNWRYDFVIFLYNFCPNSWTSNLCTRPNNDVSVGSAR